MRRLLVLCYFYPPLGGGGVHRVLGFTRHLPRHGWDCTVLCAEAGDYWVTDESLLARIPPGTEVIRVRGGSALSAWLGLTRGAAGRRSTRTFAGLRRLSDWWLMPDSYAGWSRRARAAAEGRARRGGFDAMLSSSPPDSVHLAALAVHRRLGLPWVADFRDPWVGLHFREPPSAWHRARHAALEAEVLEGADVVLAASRTHADRIGSRSPAPRRVIHLPNGFEPEEGPAASASPEPSASAADRERFELVFSGTLAQMPDAEVFLEALHDWFARRPEARRRVRARFAGPYETGYEDRSIALGLKGIVEFMGPRPHAEALALQRGAAALLLWKPRNYPTMVPGKLYEYLDSGRPILALLAPGDEAGALVERAGGEIVAPGDRAALAASLERRYTEWKAGGVLPPARPAWLTQHTRERLAARLAGVLDDLAGGRR
jgi:glycosyltransferase involved in cell wall biosynthesis